MTFTQDLYQRTTQLYAGMTTRGFSKLCGKSESYLSSVFAQKLEISNSAIVGLMSELEERKAILRKSGATSRQIQRVTDLPEFMADEIAKRNHACAMNENIKIRHMILESLSNLADREIDDRNAMPFFTG